MSKPKTVVQTNLAANSSFVDYPKRKTLSEAALAKVKQSPTEEYLARLEAEKEEAKGGWWDSNKDYFSQFRKA